MFTESPTENRNLVSIICRTLGRDQLQLALQSVASQTYPNIEIVLVDAAGSNCLNYETAAARIPVNLVSTSQPLSRSQAANTGLEAAKGKYLQFLDDDDWIDATHVSQLVEFLENSGEIRAVYSSTLKTDFAGKPTGYVFKENFDPVLLMRDNYIPIHAMLFDSALLESGCRFDEAFDIYEDWDFWLQLSQTTAFHHIDAVTAFYREGGDSDTALEDVRLRYQGDTVPGKGRAAIFDKWLAKWSGEKVNALIGQLDQSVLLGELDVQLHELGVQLHERDLQIHELDAQLRERDLQIHELDAQLQKRDLQIHRELARIAELQDQIVRRDMQITELEHKNTDKDAQLQQLQNRSKEQARHVSELEATLNAIYNSKSWKLMDPVRRVSRALFADKMGSTENSDSDK